MDCKGFDDPNKDSSTATWEATLAHWAAFSSQRYHRHRFPSQATLPGICVSVCALGVPDVSSMVLARCLGKPLGSLCIVDPTISFSIPIPALFRLFPSFLQVLRFHKGAVSIFPRIPFPSLAAFFTYPLGFPTGLRLEFESLYSNHYSLNLNPKLILDPCKL